MANYDLGLTASLYVGGFVAFLLTVLLMISIRQGWRDTGVRYILAILLGLVLVVPAFITTAFLATYVVANTTMNLLNAGTGDAIWSLIGAELQSGVLPLRIATLLVAFYMTLEILDLFREAAPPEQINALFRPKFRSRSLTSLPPVIGVARMEYITFSRFAYYLGAILLLWILIHLGVAGGVAALIMWALFFIVDDWIVVAEYFRASGGRIMPSHAYRILLFDVVIFGACAYAAYATLEPLYAWSFIAIFFSIFAAAAYLLLAASLIRE